MTRTRSVREQQREQASRDELVELMARAVPADGVVEPLDGLRLNHHSAPTALGHGVSFPALCVIAQGTKETLIGDRRYRYDPEHYLVASAAVPYATHIVEASPEYPYLGIVLALDPLLAGSVLIEAGRPAPRRDAPVPAMDVSPLDAGLLDAVVRLVRLLDTPGDTRVLAPLIKREIVYRLLVGGQGDRIRHIATLGGETNRIAAAIDRLRKEFDQPLRIDNLARDLGMSTSSFHHHFKAVTAMSPLQYQKHLRLQEARRLLLGGDVDATSAGSRVGYDDASHFTREYKRLFGEPPLRDVERLRTTATMPDHAAL